MTNNPIVEEVDRIREQMLAQYNGDLRALIEDSRRRTEELARAGHPMYTPPSDAHALTPASAAQKAG